MRRSPIGSTGLGYFSRQTILSARWVKICWLVFLVAILTAPAGLRAQTAASGSPEAGKASPAEIVPLGRFVVKDNLAVYFEFAGLDAHTESWKRTAASKMLMDTPLGGMLEEVASQLLDKALAMFPDRRVTGPEIVKLVKHAVRAGFVIAIHSDPKGAHLTVAVRGAASKEMRPVSGHLMGWMMGAAAKPKIEHPEGRTLVSVPVASTQDTAGSPWAWWAEKNDLVICTPFPAAVDATLAALDGKKPSRPRPFDSEGTRQNRGPLRPRCPRIHRHGDSPKNEHSTGNVAESVRRRDQATRLAVGIR